MLAVTYWKSRAVRLLLPRSAEVLFFFLTKPPDLTQPKSHGVIVVITNCWQWDCSAAVEPCHYCVGHSVHLPRQWLQPPPPITQSNDKTCHYSTSNALTGSVRGLLAYLPSRALNNFTCIGHGYGYCLVLDNNHQVAPTQATIFWPAGFFDTANDTCDFPCVTTSSCSAC